VGTNPKSISTWEPMLDQLRGRLNSWGHRYIIFGGRIILLNSVLNSPNFLFIFFEDAGKGGEANSEDSKKFSLGRGHGRT
jgi:hypothetical protein